MSNNPKKKKSIFDVFDDIMREMEEEMREFEESFDNLASKC
jgi:hypothetical protein